MIIDHVLNQKLYPGAGDVDDCVAVATIMCYAAQPGHGPLPTVPQFRTAAGVPDRPGPTPMSIDSAQRACAKLWPTLGTKAGTYTWATFGAALAGRRPASITVVSAKLPADLRFRFAGIHQVAVFLEGGHYWMANPLAPQGSAPIAIDPSELHAAAGAFAGGGNVAAVLFPAVPLPGPTVAELQAQVTDLQAKLVTATTGQKVAETKLADAKSRAAGIVAL